MISFSREVWFRGWLLVITCFLLTCFLLACGGRDRGAEPPLADAAGLVAQGWERFAAGDLIGARAAFEDAEATDPEYAPAPHGLGWTHLRLGQLGTAHAALERAAEDGFGAPDLDAARALVLRDLAPVDWSDARAAADRVLLAAPNYAFAHDSSLDWRDLRLLLAQASYFLGDYARVRAEIIALGAEPPDPDREDYVAELLRVLDSLG